CPAADGDYSVSEEQVREVIATMRGSKRPVIVAGNGIRLSGAQSLLKTLLGRSGIPVVMPFSAKDLVEEEHACNMGIFGTAGQRRANFTIQNSDCVLSLGAGLSC